MRRVTLIALYRQKPTQLVNVIKECQRRVANVLQSGFQGYDILQIHATLASLRSTDESEICNANFYKHRHQTKRMDLSKLLDFIRSGSQIPFQVQIGGFHNRDYPFHSQGQTPYDRSFSIQGNKVVMIGWPIRGRPLKCKRPSLIQLVQENRIYPNTLDSIRQSFQSFNILHAYHAELTDVDNDFYFRIGITDIPLTDSVKTDIEADIRKYLSSIEPVIIEVSVSNIFIASLDDETLPLGSTKIWSICDKKVTTEFIYSLYE